MAKVTLILETTTVTEAGDTAGSTINCQRVDDEVGAVQFLLTAGTCDEIVLEGRLHPDLDFVEISTSGALGSGTTEVLQTGIAIMPQMRAVMKNAAGATVKVGLME
jgi:hypothetical protein